MEKIIIKNAYENNLKHINLEIPLDQFTCVTGCSGCGKSSLVFDTIYAESQRGFLEGMTGNLYGQKLMNRPKVDQIDNLRPALNVSQNYYNVNPRSTIGTVTEISYYLRSLFSLTHNIEENRFSSNNPKAYCQHCYGLGIEKVVSNTLLIPDKEKTLKDGAILLFKGAPDSKEQKFLQALCDYYCIDINKKISELTQEELKYLLYSDEKIKYKITYKEGKRRKQHNVLLQGAVSIINEKIIHSEVGSPQIAYSKYMEEVPCHVCDGTKLSAEILKYKINGLSYPEIENLELKVLFDRLVKFDYNEIEENKRNLAEQIVMSIVKRLESLININVGYLQLSRAIPSLSGGERQRIRIATQLNCSLKGIIYILDEPCKGLHYRDVSSIIQSTKDLIKKGNTVIAIEHNKQYISSADNVIELGPVGGPNGGYLINDSVKNVGKYNNDIYFNKKEKNRDYFELKNINFRNIYRQNVKIPIGGITCITGVSGSGKSTLASVILKCFERKTNYHCDSFTNWQSIKRVVEVNQAPIGKNPRSTIVSYLEIYDEIRALYAKTEMAKKLRLNASHFSMNVKGGRCECCQGTGFQKIDLHYLPSSYIQCPECNGTRFNRDILKVTYKGKNIKEILDTPISNIIEMFLDQKKIYSVLSSMVELGLDYLKLGQMSMNLSGGEAQRIKLAKAIGGTSKANNIYILDEPTSGLNAVDIRRFESILNSLQKNNDTIIMIEHNLEFISRVADYIVDFGIYGGDAGGKIIYQGSPIRAFQNKETSLGEFCKIVEQT